MGSLVQWFRHARNADVERIGIDLSRGDEHMNASWDRNCKWDPWKWYCEQPCKTKPEIHRRCAMPNREFQVPVLCQKCRIDWRDHDWGHDMHEKCNIGCCDPTAEKPHGRCACTSYKKTFDHSGHGRDWEYGSPDKCCGRNKGGGANIIPGTKQCGCTD